MLTPPEIARSLLAAGESKARLPFGKMLLLAILAGAYQTMSKTKRKEQKYRLN